MKIKYSVLFAFFIVSLSCSPQAIKFRSAADTIAINGFSFVFKLKRTYNDIIPSAKDTVLLIYRLENGKEKLLLKHYIRSESADCNNTFTDYGEVEIKGNKLILKTDYSQQGNDPIPDRRERVYKVNEKGQVILLSDKKWRGDEEQ